MHRWCVAIFSIGSMLTITINSAVAQDRVQAGTLVCNTSMDLGVIVGSREALNCTFTPSVPGPTQSYNGTITKLGLDLGATTRGVIVWLVMDCPSASSPVARALGSMSVTLIGRAASARRRKLVTTASEGPRGMVIVILTLVQRDFWTSYPESHLMRCFTRFCLRPKQDPRCLALEQRGTG